MADTDQAAAKPKRVRSHRRAPETPDPVELAMVQASGSVAAQVLLEKQAFLIDADLEHRRLQIGGERLKRIVWFVLALLAGAILLGALYAIGAATQSRAFVMEPLRVPPALVQRGVDGTVLASRLVDDLRSFEAGTDSVRAPSSYSSSWEEDVRIAIPQAGISLGEAWRYLRDWLGNDTRVQGEAFATETGLGLTVRTSTMPGRTFTGAPADLDRLVRQAALALYKDTQPYRYGIYMYLQGDLDETASAYRLAIGRGGREAAWGHRGMGLLLREQNRFAEAAEQHRAALRTVPDHPAILFTLAQELQTLGRHEEALATWTRTVRRFEEEDAQDLRPEGRTGMLDVAQATVAALRRDWHTAALLDSRANTVGSGPKASTYRRVTLADRHLLLHDWAQAARYLAGVRLDAAGHLPDPNATDFYYVVLARLEAARGNPAAALAAFRWVGEQPGPQGPRPPISEDRANLGWHMALAGDVAGGEQVAASTNPACYPCLVRRCEIAILKRDWRSAERLADEAARQGRSLPDAYYHNGRQLLARGNLDGAIRQFEEAHRRGPRWAEPLKAKADALVRQRRLAEALRTFGQAAERAPRWGALHLAWARALWASARKDEARARMEAAGQLSLTPADREQLRRMRAVAQA